jgi:hypothetical protein
MMGSIKNICQDAYDEKNDEADENRQIGINAEEHEYPVRNIHAQHHQGTLGEVDDFHNAENKREAQGYQAVNPTHQ